MNAAARIADRAPSNGAPANGARLVATDGRPLPLAGTLLRADACAGLCRVVLEQRFVNPHAEPLTVTYLVPLPADGAVAGYAFRIGDVRVVGEIDRKRRARERFEEALIQGRTAALLEQERSSLFTQRVGNVPPGAEVVCELTIDQPLAWTEGGWEWRFPTVVAPRFLGEPGRVADAARVTVDVADGPVAARAGLALTLRDTLTGAPSSPSHALRVERDTVTLAADAALDRDIVVRWPVSMPAAHAALDVARPSPRRSGAAGAPRTGSAFGALTLVPPALKPRAVPRDLIVLIDTSGSMGGEPLDQARRVVGALVDALGPTDQLELIEFSDQPRRWTSRPQPATQDNKQAAHKWLRKLRASGGTWMRDAIIEALAPLRGEAQRQVVLVTDGLIGFESEIVAEILDRLPRGSRVHAVGVGSGVNRSLTGPAARAGRGVEIVCSLGEDVEPLVRRLMARTAAPLVVDLEVSGPAVRAVGPARLPDLFAGAPARLCLELAPEGGELVVSGRTADGEWTQRLSVPPTAIGEGSPAVVALYGREAVEDLEARAAAGAGASVDPEIEALGLEFSISTRLTSWIAVSETVTVDPTAPTRQVTQPHELPHGMSAEGVGLRPAGRASASLTQAGGLGGFGSFAEAVEAAKSMARPSAPMGGPGAPAPMAPPPPPRSAPSTGAPPPQAASYDDLEAEEAEEADEGGPSMQAPLDDDAFGDAELDEPPLEPAPAQPAKKRASLFGRLREMIGGRGEKEEKEEKAEKDAEKAKGAAPRLRRLRGRIVLQSDDRLVIEVAVDAELDWSRPESVVLALADRTTNLATLEPAGTTSPRTLRPGQTLRLVISLHVPLNADPTEIRMGDVVIDL